MTRRPSPFTLRPKKLLTALLISVTTLGAMALAFAVFYHPVMVWLNHGQWCADANSEAIVQAVHYGDECRE